MFQLVSELSVLHVWRVVARGVQNKNISKFCFVSFRTVFSIVKYLVCMCLLLLDC